MNDIDRERMRREMEDAAGRAAKKTDEMLEDELNTLLEATRVDLEDLIPKPTDEAEYKRLIEIVEEASHQNNKVAFLKDKIEEVGSSMIGIAKKAAKILG